MVEHDITKVNVIVKMFKLNPLFFTYAIIFSNKPNESNKKFTQFTMDAHIILCPSKIPIVTWVGSHELLMKFITITKVS